MTRISEVNLPDTINRILVEALAQQDTYSRGILGVPFGDEPDSRKVTREILGKVAAALEATEWDEEVPDGTHACLRNSARWLRSQAQENDDGE